MLFASVIVAVALCNGVWSKILPQGLFSTTATSVDHSNTLHSLSEDSFTALQHPFFKHRVRVKRTPLCDESVQSYTGFIDIGAKHLFFYFFESRHDPATDDVILWTNGGPGGSSAMGLFMENGPCRIKDGTGPKYHEESWNTNANIFFIDQPVGVGYSYADFGESVSTTEEAGADVAAFLVIFFEHFSQFLGRKLHLSGESFAGRYLPVFAGIVLDQNVKLIEAGLTPINLQSLLIGNGLTSPRHIFPTYYEMLCTPVSVPPTLSVDACVRARALTKRCERMLVESCTDRYDIVGCSIAADVCLGPVTVDYALNTGGNIYDITKKCDSLEDGCYRESGLIAKYLSRQDVKRQLGAGEANFTMSSLTIGKNFAKSGDVYRGAEDYLAQLLERGVRVLFYVGVHDILVNHVGSERTTLDLEWSGQADFVKQPLRDWSVDGKAAGRTRRSKNFTYASVYGAGHMVPYDKPREALVLLQRWLANEEL